jgi:hypothetical protein
MEALRGKERSRKEITVLCNFDLFNAAKIRYNTKKVFLYGG